MKWGFISITNFYEIFKGTMNQTIFTIDAYLALFVVLINLVFAILILVRTSCTTLYLVFFFACLIILSFNGPENNFGKPVIISILSTNARFQSSNNPGIGRIMISFLSRSTCRASRNLDNWIDAAAYCDLAGYLESKESE
jgi:hypothetical protein